ncbi:hypothetical protein BRC91_04025 [Halobacteriales archaeon QS_4_62_28]|nr:MAG: hypothetical protein BRC91_04025 [Halobacteriales archaeon QS_4_62_28]
MATTTDAFGDAVTRQTEQYLSAVRTCTALLPPTLLRYGRNGFTDSVAELVTSESNCDERLCELRTTLGTAEPNYTDVYLNTGAIMELFVLIDEIPNRAEQFLRELDAMRPPLDESAADALTRMAALVTRGTRILTDTVADFVTDLVRSGEPAPVVETVDQVATLESSADDIKYEVITHAFDALSTAEAVVIRDLARSLDAAIDAAEDAADQLLYVHAGY